MKKEVLTPTPTRRVVLVRFLGFLQRLTDHRETQVEIQGETTVLELLTILGKRYGPDFTSAIFRAPGEVHTYLRIFLDEKEAAPADRVDCDSTTEARMELIILPTFEGGSR